MISTSKFISSFHLVFLILLLMPNLLLTKAIKPSFTENTGVSLPASVKSSISIEATEITDDIIYDDYDSEIGFVFPDIKSVSHKLTFKWSGNPSIGVGKISSEITNSNLLADIIEFKLTSTDGTGGGGSGDGGAGANSQPLSKRGGAIDIISKIGRPSINRESIITIMPQKINLKDLDAEGAFDNEYAIEITYTLQNT